MKESGPSISLGFLGIEDRPEEESSWDMEDLGRSEPRPTPPPTPGTICGQRKWASRRTTASCLTSLVHEVCSPPQPLHRC